jgi:hypothetical protein
MHSTNYHNISPPWKPCLYLSATYVFVMIAGCTSPCQKLKNNAEHCTYAQGVYVDSRDSLCAKTREAIGIEPLTAFADCVNVSACDSPSAHKTCQKLHLPETLTTDCGNYRTWALACGLEPRGIGDDCASLIETVGKPVFSDWVTCVSNAGCPTPQSQAYTQCQSDVGGSVATILDACNRLVTWSTACGEQAIGSFTLDETSFSECIAQAQPFTIESYALYATCLEGLQCDAMVDRLICLGSLELTDRTSIEAQCAELINFSSACDSLAGGGTVEICEANFHRFSPDSLQNYIDCLKSKPCEDRDAVRECSPLLVIY